MGSGRTTWSAARRPGAQRGPRRRSRRSRPGHPEQWRIRDGAYRYAEWRARKGEGPDLEIESAPPEPGRIKELLERHRRAVAVCNSMGPGPWNVKTRSAREWNEGAYQQNYDQAIETARDLKAAGITEGVTIRRRCAPTRQSGVPVPVRSLTATCGRSRSTRNSMPREGADHDHWDLIQDDELQEHLLMAQGLAEQDAEAWGSFQEEVTSEWEKRVETTKKAEAQRRRREAAKYAASPEGKLAALRKDLAAAEQTLAESDRSPTRPITPIKPGDPINAARYKAAQGVAGIKAQVVEPETRMPFTRSTTTNSSTSPPTPRRSSPRSGKPSPRPTLNSARPASLTTRSPPSSPPRSRRRRSGVHSGHREMAYRRRDSRNATLTRDREIGWRCECVRKPCPAGRRGSPPHGKTQRQRQERVRRPRSAPHRPEGRGQSRWPRPTTPRSARTRSKPPATKSPPRRTSKPSVPGAVELKSW